MKSYTDIEQSKKLAEILPLESADMCWVSNGFGKPFARTIPVKGNPEELCACWSLAALLGVLPKIDAKEPIVQKLYYTSKPIERYICLYDLTNITSEHDNPVDACYEMILKLNKLNML